MAPGHRTGLVFAKMRVHYQSVCRNKWANRNTNWIGMMRWQRVENVAIWIRLTSGRSLSCDFMLFVTSWISSFITFHHFSLCSKSISVWGEGCWHAPTCPQLFVNKHRQQTRTTTSNDNILTFHPLQISKSFKHSYVAGPAKERSDVFAVNICELPWETHRIQGSGAKGWQSSLKRSPGISCGKLSTPLTSHISQHLTTSHNSRCSSHVALLLSLPVSDSKNTPAVTSTVTWIMIIESDWIVSWSHDTLPNSAM